MSNMRISNRILMTAPSRFLNSFHIQSIIDMANTIELPIQYYMKYLTFSPEQEDLINFIIHKIENSGCNTAEIVEVLTEICASLLSFVTPSREELVEYLENKLLPEMRDTVLAWYELKYVKEQYGNI